MNVTAPSASLLLGLAALLVGPTVSADPPVVLEFSNPVTVGSNVTLRCKKDGSAQPAYFFRNGTFIGQGPTGEFTISDIQRSHEGSYWCSTGLFSISAKSWLSVRDPDPEPDPSAAPLSAVRLLCHLVAVCPYCISTVLMLSMCCCKRTGNKSAVSMAMDNRAGVRRTRAEEHDYVTEHHF